MNTQMWNPFQEFENLLERYNKTGGSAMRNQSGGDLSFADWAPSVDIDEQEDKYLIKADLPGVDKDDIVVKLENGMLSIRGEKRTQSETDEGKRHRTERFHGTFARAFTLPESVDADRVDAAYKDGVLTLAIPKKSRPCPNRSTSRSADFDFHGGRTCPAAALPALAGYTNDIRLDARRRTHTRPILTHIKPLVRLIPHH